MTLDLRNIRLRIAYDGTEFSGWQRQQHDRTIQGEIERCLTLITCEEIHLHGAGRTDAGVHAAGMVAHFTTLATLPCPVYVRGLNAMLPGAIRVLEALPVPLEFHARFSAVGKCYQYIVYTGKIHPPHRRLYSVHVTAQLNCAAMRDCLVILVGTHDFSSFENSGSRDKSKISGRGAVRTIHQAELLQHETDTLMFQFIGDGFLRNMVRNLVGNLLDVGRGKLSVVDFRTILQAKDRTMAGATAPAHGLFLQEVLYDADERDWNAPPQINI